MSKANWDVYLFGYYGGTLTLSPDATTATKEVYEKLASIGLNCINEDLDILDILLEE